MLDCHVLKGVSYIYDWNNWVVDTDAVGGLYRLCPYVLHSVIYVPGMYVCMCGHHI